MEEIIMAKQLSGEYMSTMGISGVRMGFPSRRHEGATTAGMQPIPLTGIERAAMAAGVYASTEEMQSRMQLPEQIRRTELSLAAASVAIAER
jgi:hypothetical protein